MYVVVVVVIYYVHICKQKYARVEFNIRYTQT